MFLLNHRVSPFLYAFLLPGWLSKKSMTWHTLSLYDALTRVSIEPRSSTAFRAHTLPFLILFAGDAAASAFASLNILHVDDFVFFSFSFVSFCLFSFSSRSFCCCCCCCRSSSSCCSTRYAAKEPMAKEPIAAETASITDIRGFRLFVFARKEPLADDWSSWLDDDVDVAGFPFPRRVEVP